MKNKARTEVLKSKFIDRENSELLVIKTRILICFLSFLMIDRDVKHNIIFNILNSKLLFFYNNFN